MKVAGQDRSLGLYGFGAAAHILAQVARCEGRSVFAFTRPGDVGTQTFARSLGAVWAGGSDEAPPQPLDAAIIFASVAELVPVALKAVRKGSRVVCAGIHMSDIPSFPGLHGGLWNLQRHGDLLDAHLLDRAQREHGPKGIEQHVNPRFHESAYFTTHGGSLGALVRVVLYLCLRLVFGQLHGGAQRNRRSVLPAPSGK